MGLGTISTRSNTTILASWFNDLKAVLSNDLVPRNLNGIATDKGGSLGTADYGWLNGYFQSLVVGGVSLDSTLVAGKPHRIRSAKAKTSGYPNFLTAAGSGNGLSATLSAAATNMVAVINTTSLTVSADILFGSLVAAPSSNNTCLVNDATLVGQDYSKLLGEYGNTYITIDSIGTGITALNGTIAAFKRTNEVFLALVDASANRLWPIYRGWAGTAREALSDDDTFTLLKLNTLLLNVDGSTHVSSTYYPASVGVSPAAATSGKVYFERSTGKHAYDNGATIDLTYLVVGWAICDSADCKWVQGYDIDLGWKPDIDVRFKVKDNTTVTVLAGSLASVAGTDNGFVADVDMTQASNMDSGETIAANSTFFIYMKNDGSLVFSSIAPRLFGYLVKGFYHPHEYYRCIAAVETGASSVFVYELLLGDDVNRTTDAFLTTGSSSDLAVTLPSARLFKGRRLNIFKSDSGSKKVAITPMTGETISGDTARGLLRQYNYLKVVSDGSNWIQEDYETSCVHTTLLNDSAASPISYSLTLRRRGDTVSMSSHSTVTWTQAASTVPNFATAVPIEFWTKSNFGSVFVPVTNTSTGAVLPCVLFTENDGLFSFQDFGSALRWVADNYKMSPWDGSYSVTNS